MPETVIIGADGKARINWLASADPRWYGRVLAVLHRDHPDIESAVWSTAIEENAAGQCARREAEARNA